MVKHVTSAELEELIKGDKAVFCDFWASWCGPCRMLAPVFEAVAEKYEGQAEFVKVNVDEEEDAAIKYRISSIPNILAFKGGEVKANNLGFVPAEALEGFVQSNL
ncbi:MAG: thioredoxin [Clostridia bacterium]|nr:thioredoxin [Clostridia bacterium]